MFSVTSYKASGVRGPVEAGRSQPRVSYRQLDTTIGHQRILQVPTKKKEQRKKTIAAITEATSYQSIAKECKIGQNKTRNHLEDSRNQPRRGRSPSGLHGIPNAQMARHRYCKNKTKYCH